MSFWRKKHKSPEEKLRQKVRKRIKNQSGFLKHSIVYFTLLFFFLIVAYFIRVEGFIIPFLITFLSWSIGLVFHGLSAFVFNKIDSWEETRYHQKLIELQLSENKDTYPDDDPNIELEDPMDLKSYERLRKELDDKWGEGDFV